MKITAIEIMIAVLALFLLGVSAGMDGGAYLMQILPGLVICALGVVAFLGLCVALASAVNWVDEFFATIIDIDVEEVPMPEALATNDN